MKPFSAVRRLLLSVLIPALLSSHATAKMWGNPDAYPSFAIGFDSGNLSGDGELFADILSSPIRTDDELKIQAISPSFRFPIAPNASLDFRATFFDYKQTTTGEGWKSKSDLSGQSFGGTLRIYLK